MGREKLAALARIIQEQIDRGASSPLVGTWTIRYDAQRDVLYFDKCEFGDYCEERPTVIDFQGRVIDEGGPILVEG